MSRQTELKVLRARFNLTQEQTADALEVPRQQYSYIERGERKGSAETWLKIQKLFGLSDGKTWRLMNELDEAANAHDGNEIDTN